MDQDAQRSFNSAQLAALCLEWVRNSTGMDVTHESTDTPFDVIMLLPLDYDPKTWGYSTAFARNGLTGMAFIERWFSRYHESYCVIVNKRVVQYGALSPKQVLSINEKYHEELINNYIPLLINE